MSFRIITDSSSNLVASDVEKLGIDIISYTFNVLGKDYKCYNPNSDGVEEAKRYYNILREGAEIKTSLINADKFLSYFESVMAEGEDVLFIGMSSGVSGSVQAARMAAEEAMEKYEGRNCIVVDSLCASLGEAILVIEAVKMRDEGKSLTETAVRIERMRTSIRQEFTVDDLKYLKRGGRISPATAMLGGMLNIKPLLYGTDSGKIESFGKVRGRMKALTALADSCAENLRSPDDLICISHADCENAANMLVDMIKDRIPANNFMIRYYDLCTGAHIGPDTVAIFYMSRNGRKIK